MLAELMERLLEPTRRSLESNETLQCRPSFLWTGANALVDLQSRLVEVPKDSIQNSEQPKEFIGSSILHQMSPTRSSSLDRQSERQGNN